MPASPWFSGVLFPLQDQARFGRFRPRRSDFREMNVPAAGGKKRGSLSQGLEVLLSEHILEGRLRGGEQLPTESALMLEHGVSRTVVREAMSRLQAAGMVETRHGI